MTLQDDINNVKYDMSYGRGDARILNCCFSPGDLLMVMSSLEHRAVKDKVMFEVK